MEELVTMVDMISAAKKNIVALEEKKKEIKKALASFTQELENVEKNITMFNRVLDNLNGIREEEIQIELKGEKPVKEKKEKAVDLKKDMIKTAKKLIAIDEKGDKIAEYKSQHEAAQDLGYQYATISWRVRNMKKEAQLKKFGYALIAQ